MKELCALLFLFATRCCLAQYCPTGCGLWSLTPAQLDSAFNTFHSFPDNSSLPERPSGESVSLARLRHKPPHSARNAFVRGLKCDKAGEFQNAALEFEKTIALDPEFSEAHGNLGVEYTALGRLDEAVVEFHRALALDPATGFHHSNLAYAMIRLHREKDAEKEAREAVGLDPGNIPAHFMLGYVLAGRRETREMAEPYLVFAARTMPEAHLILARIYEAEGASQIAVTERERYRRATSLGSRGQPGHLSSFLPQR